jgi:hypothetical protein
MLLVDWLPPNPGRRSSRSTAEPARLHQKMSFEASLAGLRRPVNVESN